MSLRLRSVRTAILSGSACVALAAIPILARGDLVLNEILYDPDGADEGNEFVELWNPDPEARALDGLTIEAGDGANADGWVVIWRGAPGDSVPPRAPLLITGRALSGAMQNGPDAVRILRSGQVLDLLGYGNLTVPSLYEGAPAPDVSSGQTLARSVDGFDTNVNGADWIPAAEPTPGLPNFPDARLRFSRSGLRIAPEVAWPGESVQFEAWIRNSGRLGMPGGRWRVDVEASQDSASVWTRLVVAPGVDVAPAESALVGAFFPAPPAGGRLLRARLRTVDADSSAVSDTALVGFRSVAGPAVVSEIAFRDSGAGEWIELWFRDAVPDLTELSIADASAAPRAIDAGALPRGAAPGSFLVVAQDPARVRARFALPDSQVVGLTGGWPSLNDTGDPTQPTDRVRVLGPDGIPSDSAPYDAGAVERDGSLERLSIDLPSLGSGAWAETIDPAGGTPGRPNSLQAPDGRGEDHARGLIRSGSRVVRRSGERVVPVVLRTTAEARGRALTVRVHDLLGRPLRALVEGQRLSAEAAFLWDGTDDRGGRVPPGLYVIRAETLPEGGTRARKSNLAIAVAAEGPR